MAPTARQQRPNDDGRISASQAELSHCRWHQDGGKSNPTQYHITTGITYGGRSVEEFMDQATSGDYKHLLRVVMEWFDVDDDG